MVQSTEPGLLPELEQLLSRFFFSLDHFDYDGLLALTSEDFRWHRQGKILNGHSAVRDALGDRPATRRTAHILSNTFIAQADAVRALTESCITAYRSDDADPQGGPVTIAGPSRINRVSTRFERNSANHWLIVEQKLVPIFLFGV